MYKIIITPSAQKEIRKIDNRYYKSIVNHIDELAGEPRPAGFKKIVGEDNVYRIRVGIYRIIYTIEEDILTIEIIRIAHRSNAYR